VLVGGHGAGVDIEIGVQFLDGDFQLAALEEIADGSDGDTFAYGTDHAAGYKDVLSRHTLELNLKHIGMFSFSDAGKYGVGL